MRRKKTEHLTVKHFIAKANAAKSEDAIQSEFVSWCRLNPDRHRGLELIYHCPNQGTRSGKRGKNHNAMGVLAGIPDLFLPVAIGDYHGLYLEFKTAKGRVSKAQKAMHQELLSQGYMVALVRSCYEAICHTTLYYERDM